MKSAFIRFYEELNDFLPHEKRKVQFPVHFSEGATVKSLIESEKVPHTEVDLALVNGRSVPFNEKVREGDQISVYPVFESMDISPLTVIRLKPLREPKFVLDVHLGKLARYLRILGFDTLYQNTYTDDQLSLISVDEKRCILTRDVRLLMRKAIERGYWIRNTQADKQLAEVISRFDLKRSVHYFARCTKCNGKLFPTDEQTVRSVFPVHHFDPDTFFYQCENCRHIYWNGAHYNRFVGFAGKILDEIV